MSAGGKYLPKPKRPVHRKGVLEKRADHCARCGGRLDEGRYHDCGDQLTLPVG